MALQPRPDRRASREGWSSGTSFAAGAAVTGSVAVVAGAAVAPIALGVGVAVAVVAAAKKVASLLARRRGSKDAVREQVQRRNPRVSDASDSELWAELAARHNLRQQGAVQPGPRRQENQAKYADVKNNAAKFDVKTDKPGLKNSKRWKTMAKWGKAVGKGLMALARKSKRFNKAEATIKNSGVVRNTRKAMGAVKKGSGRRRRTNTRPAATTQAPQTQNLTGPRAPDTAPTAQVGAAKDWKPATTLPGKDPVSEGLRNAFPGMTVDSTDALMQRDAMQRHAERAGGSSKADGTTVVYGDKITQHGKGSIGKVVVKTSGTGNVDIGSVSGNTAVAVGKYASAHSDGGPAISVGSHSTATSGRATPKTAPKTAPNK